MRTVTDACAYVHTAVDTIRTLLLNMQHILNSLRPFEAREELIAEAQAQVDAKRCLVAELRSACLTRGDLEATLPPEHAQATEGDRELHAPPADSGPGAVREAQAFLECFVAARVDPTTQ
jgi:hypothetical protein